MAMDSVGLTHPSLQLLCYFAWHCDLVEVRDCVLRIPDSDCDMPSNNQGFAYSMRAALWFDCHDSRNQFVVSQIANVVVARVGNPDLSNSIDLELGGAV
jgi:hypothetical protein